MFSRSQRSQLHWEIKVTSLLLFFITSVGYLLQATQPAVTQVIPAPLIPNQQRESLVRYIASLDREITKLSQSIRSNPNDEDFLRRALLYKARSAINRVMANSTQSVTDCNNAVADFTQATKLNHNNAKAYFLRGGGTCEVTTNKVALGLALADYTQAIKLDPTNGSYYHERGHVYRKKGDLDRAIADYSQSIRFAPEVGYYYYSRGRTYKEKGDLNRAIADYTQAINHNWTAFDAYYERGQAYSKLGAKQEAIADFQMSLKLTESTKLQKDIRRELKKLDVEDVR